MPLRSSKSKPSKQSCQRRGLSKKSPNIKSENYSKCSVWINHNHLSRQRRQMCITFFRCKKEPCRRKKEFGQCPKEQVFLLDCDWKLFFGSMIEKYLKNLTWTFCHRRVRLTTDSRQSELRGINYLSELFSIICHNHLSQSFSIIFQNYFQLFVRIDFYHLSELFSIICEIYLQLFVRFNWFQPFLQIISIASQNNTISFNYWANKAPITDVRYRNCNVIRPKMHLSPGTIFRAIANFECSHVRFEYFTLI